MLQAPPAVSVIITTHNYARFIVAAVESVLRQTTPPAEIVVVDDGSTDETSELVKPYLSRGVRYIWQPQAGAGAARNRGLLETNSPLVAFLDADDRWLPHKLTLQLEHLQRYPRAALVTGSEWQVGEEGGNSLLLRRPAAGAICLYPKIMVENLVGNPSLTLIRRDCFRQVGTFDEGLRLGQDWDMWIRIAKRFLVGVVNEPLILFTRHAGSLTAGQTSARRAYNELIHQRYIPQVRAPLKRLMLWRSARSMSDFYAAAAIVDRPGHRWPAARAALNSLLLDPVYRGNLKVALFIHAAVGLKGFHWLSRRMAGARKRMAGDESPQRPV